jgi:hypothetical protein
LFKKNGWLAVWGGPSRDCLWQGISVNFFSINFPVAKFLVLDWGIKTGQANALHVNTAGGGKTPLHDHSAGGGQDCTLRVHIRLVMVFKFTLWR